MFNLYFIPVQINEESATPFIATYTYSTIPGGLVFLWTIASIHSLCYKLIMKGYINDLMFFWRAMLPAENKICREIYQDVRITLCNNNGGECCVTSNRIL